MVTTVNNWLGVITEFDSVMTASLESMKLKQKVAWRNDRLRINEELKVPVYIHTCTHLLPKVGKAASTAYQNLSLECSLKADTGVLCTVCMCVTLVVYPLSLCVCVRC